MEQTVTREFDLGYDIKVRLHAPDGFDEFKAWGIGQKIQADSDPRVIEMGETGYMLARDRFQIMMALTDSITGIPFELVTAQNDTKTITEAFLHCMSLPRSLIKRWSQAAYDMADVLNDPDLLPAEKVGAGVLTDPLSNKSAASSTPKSKTS